MSASDIASALGPGGITAVGIALAMLGLFITGQIVPKSRIDEMKERLDEMREERDEWKRTAEVNGHRAETAVLTGQIVRDVMQGLRKEIQP
jgi:hypothetical protein